MSGASGRRLLASDGAVARALSRSLIWRGAREADRARDALIFVAVAAGYIAGYRLAQHWFSAEDQGASFFPAAGVTLAALVLLPRRRWPVVLVAAGLSELVLDLSNGTGIVPSLGYALANTMEPLVGAVLLTAIVTPVDIRRTRDLAVFITCAVIVAPVVGGVIAATTFVYVDGHSGWARFAFEWWSGDGLGVLVVGSALLAMRFAQLLSPRQWVEGAVLAVLAVASTALVFDLGWFEFVYLPAAVLVIVAFRIGTTGVAVTGALVAFVAAGATAEAQDFWTSVDVSPANRVLYLQLGLAVIVGAVLALAAEIWQRERIAVALAQAESERRAAVERATLAESEQVAHRRTARLQALTASLAAAASVRDVADAVATHGVAMLEADAGFVSIPTEDGLFEIIASHGWPEDVIASWTPYPASAAAPMNRAAAKRDIVVVDPLHDAGAGYPASKEVGYPGDTAAGLVGAAAPLIATSGLLLGVVYIAFHRLRAFEEPDRQMLQALVSQGALALERAATFEQEQEARQRAELLERHVAQLAVAESAVEVAEAALSGLEEIGVDAAWVQCVRDGHLAMVGQMGMQSGGTWALVRYPLHHAIPAAEAVRTGSVAVVNTRAELEERYPAAVEQAERYGLESQAIVPLRTASGTTIGALTVASMEERWLDARRRAIVTALAEQCGLALERVELRSAAAAAAMEAALMARLGDVLERATTVTERARVLVRTLVAQTATLAVVHLLDKDGRPRMIAHASSDGQDPGVARRRAAVALAVATVSTGRHEQAHAHGLDLVGAPLRARGRVIGVLTLGTSPTASQVTPILGQRIAARAALALDNALLYEQERDVSHSLQMGLLGGEIQKVPGAEIATAYRAAAAALEVGGDWHDAFALPDGRVALVVGDVVGHGLEAAVAMGQLRGAVRALAAVGPGREVLARLDDFVDTLPEAGMATLVYAELDLTSGTIAYACAGHPPPLVVSKEGQARLLWEGRSVPLGSAVSRDWAEALDRLDLGDTLVLYSDGLIERRREGISAGLDLLVDVASGAGECAPPDLVDRILDGVLAEDEQDDDVCILAVRYVGAVPHFAHTFPAAAEEIGQMRRELRAWLEQVDVAPSRVASAVLATSEAAANAAEHAYGFDGVGLVDIEGWLMNGEVQLTVRDAGEWQSPRPDTDRGRGLTIIEALMPNVAIQHGDTGTVVRMSMPCSAEAEIR